MKKNDSDLIFWKKRSEKFNSLGWVKDKNYLKAFIGAGNFKKNDVVLDVGTGTGIIAHVISPLVGKVVGLDTSQDMLSRAIQQGNEHFIKADIRQSLFDEDTFDKVTARQVFHHILEDTQKAMDQCYGVLKKGGRMILAEGVPPNKRAKEDYIKIFKLKEKRLTFMSEDLERLMENSGFKKIEKKIIWQRKMSFKNWLVNSDLPDSVQDKIFMMRKNSPDYIRKSYNMIETKDDLFLDFKVIILIGEK